MQHNLAFEGSLIAEIFTPPEAQEVLAILESPPNPVILKHQGVTAYASVTIFGKGGQGVYSVQRKCAAAAVAMTQVKRLQMQMQNDLEGMMTSCHQSIQDFEFHQSHFELIFFRWVETVLKPPTSLSLTCARRQPSKCFFVPSAPGSRWKIASDRS